MNKNEKNYDLKREAILSQKQIELHPEITALFPNPLAGLAYRIEKEDPIANIKNWLRYRICTKLHLYTVEEFDCDTTPPVLDMLKRLLTVSDSEITKIEERRFRLENGIILETDTMYSFATPFNIFMRYLLKTRKLDPNFVEDYMRIFELSKPKEPYRDLYFLANMDAWYEKVEDDPQIARVFRLFDEFAVLTHTLGNMTLVPLHYNVARSSECWDETLLELQNIRKRSHDINFDWYFDHFDLFAYDVFFENGVHADSRIAEIYDRECFDIIASASIGLETLNRNICRRGEILLQKQKSV